MKLIHLHIENFGILSDYDYRFEEGLNVIKEENGFGKTSLGAFIKVMFYGFENEGKAKAKRERLKYLPWQGGIYGGSLQFEHGGKEYKLTRSFGEDKKKDSFELTDALTKLESQDFDSETIGETIFDINGESFARTLFISQNEYNHTSFTDIDAKIGNLVEAADDLGSHDQAMKQLEKQKDEIGTYRRGALKEIKLELDDLKNKLLGKTGIENAMRDTEAEIHACDQSILKKKEEAASVQEQMGQVAKIQDRHKNQKAYETLLASYKDSKEKYLQERSFFPGEVPDAGEVSLAMEEARKLKSLYTKMEDNLLSESQAKDLNELEEKYKDLDFGEEDLGQVRKFQDFWCGEREELKDRIRQRSLSNAEADQSLDAKKKSLLIGIIFFALGISWWIALPNMKIFGVAFLVLGIGGIVSGKYKSDCNLKESKKQAADANLKDEERLSYMEKEVRDFLAKYHSSYSEANVLLDLNKIIEDFKTLESYRDTKNVYEQARSQYEVTMKKIAAFLEGYGFPFSKDLEGELDEIKEHLSSCQIHEAIYITNKTKKENFERDHEEYQEFLAPARELEEDALGKLTRENKRLSDEIAGLEKQRLVLDRKLNDLNESYNEICECEERMQVLKERKVACTEKKKILEKAMEHLEIAKNNLNAKYAAPIEGALKDYFAHLAEGSDIVIDIDAKRQVLIKEKGASRPQECMSSGYRDLIDLCYRFALAKAMYPEGHVLLILDDPFSNLDEEKLQKGLKLIRQLSEVNQVLYFTCHNSRSIQEK